MKFPVLIRRHIFWLNLPSTILITLLQRSPVLRLVGAAEELVVSSPLGSVLRSAFAGSVSLGAIATLAGATAGNKLQAYPTSSPAVVHAGSWVTFIFYSPSQAVNITSWTTTGSVPPGLAFSWADPNFLYLDGVPTAPGSYIFSVTGSNPAYETQLTLAYTINVLGPLFTTQPVATQTASVGANVTFTVAASGSPAPTYQWRKGAGNLGGATSATLSLNNVQLTDAGVYSVAATNASGSVTSDSAVLTVNQLTQAVTFAALPDIVYTTTPLALSASATSSLAVSFSVLSGPAILSGNALTLTGVGPVTVRAAQPGDATTYGAAPVVDRTFNALPGFLSWQQSRFTAGELANPSVSGPHAVCGCDELTNLVKYALGLEPTTDATAGLPVLSTTATDWVYTYTRPGNLTDVIYAVEVSTDSVNWTMAGVTHELVSSSGGLDTWQARYALGSTTDILFRLRITRP